MSDDNCKHEWGTDLNGNNTECTLCGIKLHQFDGVSTTDTLIDDCDHDWDVDYSTMLMSDPPQYNVTCNKCGEKTTKTQEECFMSNAPTVDKRTWHEKGELPPVGEVCLARYMGGSHIKTKPLFIGKEKFFAQDLDNGIEFAGTIENWTFEPIPIKKIVDMSLFAGTDFLLKSKITGFNNLASDLSVCHLHKYTPYIDHPNAVKNLTEEPECLKPFKYKVLEAYAEVYVDGEIDANFANIEHDRTINWSNVVHITITGLKDGWEYGE